MTMKFTVDRALLKAALGWAGQALPDKPLTPVIAGLQITAAGHAVTVGAFNFDTAATATISDVTVQEAGTVLLSGRLLTRLVALTPDQPITFAEDGGYVHMSCGSSSAELMMMPAEEYPTLPDMPPPVCTVSGRRFKLAAEQATPAGTADDKLQVLQNVHLKFEAENLLLTATDKYRAAIADMAYTPTSAELPAAALVSCQALERLAKGLPDDCEVQISVGCDATGVVSTVGFAYDGHTLVTRAGTGEYPSTRKLFSAPVKAECVISVADLAEAVRRAEAVMHEPKLGVQFSFGPEGVLVTANDGETARTEELVPAACSGEEMVVRIRPDYLLAALKAINDDMALITMTSAAKALRIRPNIADDAVQRNAESGIDYVVMPLRPI